MGVAGDFPAREGVVCPVPQSGCSAGTDAGAERGHIRVAVADFRDTRVEKKEHVDSGPLLESGPGGPTHWWRVTMVGERGSGVEDDTRVWVWALGGWG